MYELQLSSLVSPFILIIPVWCLMGSVSTSIAVQGPPDHDSFQAVIFSKLMTSEQEKALNAERINRKRKEIEKGIERVRQFASGRKQHLSNSILQLPIPELISKLQSRELKAEAVLMAFAAKTLQETETSNFISEFIDDKFKLAASLDSAENVVGPLHGLPFTVSDEVNLKGYDPALGYAKDLFNPANRTANIVSILETLGAIPLAKTVIAQTGLGFGSENPISGKTFHPLNNKLSAGGPSSGAGAAVSSGSIPLAIGYDLFGGIRSAAHFHGGVGLKPTSYRITMKGMTSPLPKVIGIRGSVAALAPDTKTLTTVFKALLERKLQHKHDLRVIPLDWREHIYSSSHKLRIGYFTTMKFFPALPEVQSAVSNAKAALESRGHILVPFEIPNDFKITETILNLIFADRGKYLREKLFNEEVSESIPLILQILFQGQNLNNPNGAKQDEIISKIGTNINTGDDVLELESQRKTYRLDVIKKMRENGLDLILGPVVPFPALQHEDMARLLPGMIYSIIWNILDFPAGVVQAGVQQSSETPSEYDDQGSSFLKIAKAAARHAVGMPIGVQIAGRAFNEETVLRAMSELEEAMKIDEDIRVSFSL